MLIGTVRDTIYVRVLPFFVSTFIKAEKIWPDEKSLWVHVDWETNLSSYT